MHDALVRGAALRVSGGAPLTNPHPRNASGASLAARVKFFLLRLRYMEFRSGKFLKFKNSKILLRRILPLEFRLWRRFLLRGRGATYSASLRSQETPQAKPCVATLVLRGAPLSL